ncbi:hypothetical protein ABZV60_15535 [Streptomyces sp. NPDC004787]|uniref:hypothetical protein n=1 Tax=Streptomyces sp. NPDC004787 TaxID=3154291 RepID=UPI0033AA1469
MEQRTGPSSIQAVQGAAADPAFVPGITGVTGVTGPAPADPAPAAGPADEPRDAVPQDAVPEDAEPRDAAPGPDGAAEEPVDGGAEVPVDGPVFEAADRRARIVADAEGIRLSLDEESCEFRWDEIGAVETAIEGFGKRFVVTVHTPDRRWWPIEIDAPSRSRVKEWEPLLDAVLDAYFEDGA